MRQVAATRVRLGRVATDWFPLGAQFVVLSVVSAVLVQGSRGEWVGWWPATWAQMQNLDIWGAPITAVTGAWVGAQPRRHGFDEWRKTGAVSFQRQQFRLALMVATSSMAGYAVVILWMAVETARVTAGSDHALLWLVPPTLACAVIVWSALGVWLGAHLPLLLALPSGFAVPYAIATWMALSGVQSPVGALAVANFKVYDEIAPAPGSTITRLIAWAALALTAGAALRGVTGARRRVTLAFLSTALTFTAVAGLTLTPMPRWAAAVCRGTAPTVCTSVAYESVLPVFEQHVRRLWPDVPRAFATPYVLSPEVAARTIRPATAAADIRVGPASGNFEPALVVDGPKTTARMGHGVFGRFMGCGPEAGEDALSLAAAQVWWLRSHHLPIDGTNYAGEQDYSRYDGAAQVADRYGDLAALTPAEREAWFAALFARVQQCRV